MSILYIDCSYSVSGCSFYWEEVKKILNNNNIEKYYLWNSSLFESNKEEIKKYIIMEKGFSGTTISNVALSIIKKKYENNDIIIITDGEVIQNEVIKCEKILSTITFTNIECYIITSKKINDIDISVPLPFIKRGNSKLYISNNDFSLKLLKEFDIDKIKNIYNDITVDNLVNNYDKVYDILNIINMNNNGLQLIKEKILNIRNDIIKEYNKNLNKDDGLVVQDFLNKEDYKNAINTLHKIENNFNNNEPNDIYGKINKLLSLCDDRTNQGFGLYNKINNSKNVEEVKPVEDISLSNYDFEDPILLDIDVPQLVLLEPEEPIFDDKNILKQLIENPLSIIYDEKIKNKISKCIGNILGVKITNKITIDPFTRRKIIGSIPLTIDNEQHLKVGSNNLYKFFTKGKIIGNCNLYYIIIWYIITKDKKCKYLIENENDFNNHLKYRLNNTKTYISLCGLPEYNRTIVPTSVAIYYIVNCNLFNKNVVILHLFNTDVLIDILENILNYKIDKNIIEDIDISKVIRVNQKIKKTKLMCLCYSHKIFNNNIILYDKEVNEEEYNNILKLLPPFFKRLDKKKLLEYLNIEFKKSWNYEVKKITPMFISLKTFRPFYVDNWKELSYTISNINVKYQVSGYNDYIRCYIKYHKFVSYEEFELYVFKKYKKPVHTDLKTIYSEIYISYNEVRDYIEKNNLSYDDVKDILLKSCSIKNRITIQKIF
jgi:hypothetical protein